jgi:radical SAM protein with 4Fe4S-binding SPASM domain
MNEIKYLPKPKVCFIQWHITERCNLRCKHCYQTSYSTQELPLKKLINIFYEYIELLNSWKITGRIQLTGGEPFLRQDALFRLLELCHDYKKIVPYYGIMSNGYFITEEIARKLRELEIHFFQVSLEGTEKINNSIRGQGSFKKTIQAIKTLVREGVPTHISFTSNRTNWKEYTKLIKLAKNLNVNFIWSDRMIPIGSGMKIKNQMLQPLEVKKFYKNTINAYKNLIQSKSKTQVAINRTLYFLATDNMHGSKCCALGTRGLAIMPNGDIYPCRRMPIKVGNLNEQSLFEIWYSSDLLWKLRDKNYYMNSICKKCQFFEECGGGAPCLTYGYCGNPFAPDPQCWIAFSKLPDAKTLRSTTLQNRYCKEKPMFWNNIVPSKITDTLDSYFEINGNNLFYNYHNKKIKLIKNRNDIIKGKNIFLIIDNKNTNFKKIAKKIIQQKPDIIFISFNFKISSYPKKEIILNFLQELKKSNINFRLTKALPKTLFGKEYFMTRKFHIPFSLKESPELFIVNNGLIEFPLINKIGPPVRYIGNKNQIYEYFEILNNKLTKHKKEIKKQFTKKIDSLKGDIDKIMYYQ